MKYKDCINCGKPGVEVVGHMHNKEGGEVPAWWCKNCVIIPRVLRDDRVLEFPSCLHKEHIEPTLRRHISAFCHGPSLYEDLPDSKFD